MRNRNGQGLILAVLALIYGLIFMERTAPGLVTPELLRLFRVTPSVLSFMTLGQYAVYAMLQIPVALLARRIRPEFMLVAGTVLDGGGTLVFAASHSFAMVVASRVMVGLGDAFIWLNVVAVLARWFNHGVFGRVLGITGMAGNLGALVASVPLAVWIESSGWRQPFWVMGTSLMALALVSAVVFMRLTPVHPEVQAPTTPIPWRSVFRRPRALLAVSLGHFGLMGPFLGFISLFAVPYIRANYHLSEVAAGAYLAFGLMGSLAGGPLGGYFSDRLGVQRPYRAISVLSFFVWGILTLWPSQLALPLLALLFAVLGFCNGASVLTFAVVRHDFPPEAQGLASGIANTSGFLGAVAVPLFMGLILTNHGTPRAEMAISLPFALVSIVGTSLLSSPGRRGRSE